MNKTYRMIVAVLGGIGLFVGGVFVGRANSQAIQPGWMMGNFEGQYGTDMMNGPGMMGSRSGQTMPGMMNGGMMNGNMMGMMMNGSDRMGYGMMGAHSMGDHSMGDHMMGNFGYAPEGATNVTAEEAVVLAQEYLDEVLPGKTADDHANAFPGYYALHVLENGEVFGMLSVHATTGQVFLHHWHGDSVEMPNLDRE